MKYMVALSYATEDEKIAESVYHYLKAQNISVFFAPAPECQAILSGKNQHEIFYEVFGLTAEYVALFVSKSYIERRVPMEEASIAIANHNENGSVIPIYLDGTSLPDNLFNPNSTNYFKSNSPAEIAKHLAMRIRPMDNSAGKHLSSPKTNNTMNINGNQAGTQVFIQTWNGR